MLERLTYVQIGDRLNISPEGARAIVKRNRLPRSHDKNGKALVAIDLDKLGAATGVPWGSIIRSPRRRGREASAGCRGRAPWRS